MVLEKFLEFIENGNPGGYSDKKKIDIIKQAFLAKPNRNIAYSLLEMDRKDVFEVAQEITKSVDDLNLEKLWFLLIISTKLGFTQKIRSLLESIREIDKSDDIYKFYIHNYQLFENPDIILNIIEN
jgi:ribosome biogenesis protein Nip4